MLAYCHAHDLPVTPRGAGTGNYGFDAATGRYVDLVEAGGIGAAPEEYSAEAYAPTGQELVYVADDAAQAPVEGAV